MSGQLGEIMQHLKERAKMMNGVSVMHGFPCFSFDCMLERESS